MSKFPARYLDEDECSISESCVLKFEGRKSFTKILVNVLSRRKECIM